VPGPDGWRLVPHAGWTPEWASRPVTGPTGEIGKPSSPRWTGSREIDRIVRHGTPAVGPGRARLAEGSVRQGDVLDRASVQRL